MLPRLLLLTLLGAPALAQGTCEGILAYSSCEMNFPLSADALKAHPNPYLTADLHAEFRSPRFRTYLMPAFWDGTKLVVRFTPTESGDWTYRLTSNLPEFDGKEGKFTTGPSEFPGFVNAANVHHWATDNKQPHLWMGYIADRFPFVSQAEFDQILNNAAQNKFTHIRGSILGSPADRQRVYLGPGRPNEAYFQELDQRILAIHKRGLTADLMLASDPAYIQDLFPDWRARERFIRFVVARYAPFNITWQGVENFEDFQGGRELLKELGLDIKKLDPYQHPRSSNAKVTSSSLLPDGWMNFIIDASMNDQVGSVEHQLYTVPFVAVTDTKHLWNSTMNGQYPEIRDPSSPQCKYWFDFLADTRHWELEPYFDIDGARAVALEDVEYLSYIEHPGPPVEVTVEKHGYDVMWMDPATGQTVDAKKYKGEYFTGEAPDKNHPWVLLVAREGRKESMLKSYKFDSRPVPVQELEANPQKVPYTIAEPSVRELKVDTPVRFAVKLTRETRATRSMMYLWTGEVAADGQGTRVLATGAQGSLVIPAGIAVRFPAVLSVHITALNANGKAYTTDRVFTITK